MSNGNGNSAVAFIFGLVMGAVIGAATALLLAPMTGSELREQLASQAQKEYDLAKQEYEKQAMRLRLKNEEMEEELEELEDLEEELEEELEG